jgi:DNA processing protein
MSEIPDPLVTRLWNLCRIKGLGPRTLRRLYENYPRASDFLGASTQELAATLQVDPQKTALCDRSDRELQKALQPGLAVHSPWSRFPALLRELPDPPPLLFSRGSRALNTETCGVAIVGSRSATAEGLLNARRLAAALTERGITVISGLARGIDAAALAGALDAGGQPIAVLGHGLHMIAPRSNEALGQRIAKSGLLLSEHPWGTAPAPHYFPQRNRIISGLSWAVLVVEATLRSGALITARYALEQNREVLAVPGSISSPQSQGPHALIKDGAALVETVEDILAQLPAAFREATSGSEIRPTDQPKQPVQPIHPVRALLAQGPMSAVELAARLRLSASALTACLAELELQGLVAVQGLLVHLREPGPPNQRR